MQFVVRSGQGKRVKQKFDKYPVVVLTRDNWNDYGYKTTFDAVLHLTDETIELGAVKILHAEQESGFTTMPSDPFGKLGKEYCSLGSGMEYYEKLFKCGPAVYREYLKRIRDAVFSETVLAKFEDKEGFKVSLLRFGGAERTIKDAARLFKRTTPPPTGNQSPNGFLVKFKTRVSEDAVPVLLEFDFRKRGGLPNRFNVLIGYNGTGKTKLLSNLAVVASGYGYENKEDLLEKRYGRFVANESPFKSVVVISYSAFDTFVIPGKTELEKDRLKNEGTIFGYSYCGLRERVKKSGSHEELRYRLRTPDEIESEFLNAMLRIRNSDRIPQFAAVVQPLLEDASFLRIGLTHIYANQNDMELTSLFRSLSSGHKIVLKIAADLVATMNGTHPTLVLIDEPETHLHPPLLASLLKCVRVCLDQFDGFSVIATHSPVVLQESPSRLVHVLKRLGGAGSSVVKPSIETFGENVGVITQDVFNLDDSATDWHDTLSSLATRLSLEEIEALFGNKLGFGARSYVASLFMDDEE